jgi:hypothetical protein
MYCPLCHGLFAAFYLASSVCRVLPVLFCLSILPVPSGCPFCLSFSLCRISACPALSVQFCQFSSARPVLPVLFLRSYPCPVVTALSWQASRAVLSRQSLTVSHVLAALFCLYCPLCYVMFVAFYLVSSVCCQIQTVRGVVIFCINQYRSINPLY